MTNLYLTYEEYRTGGEVSEWEEDPNYIYANHDDEYVHFTPESVFLKEQSVPSWNKEMFEIEDEVEKGDTIHLVIVRYFDGGTFGRTCGYWSIFGATKNEELAQELYKAIPKGDWKSSPILSQYAYAVWDGYFSGLEDVEIHTFEVK